MHRINPTDARQLTYQVYSTNCEIKIVVRSCSMGFTRTMYDTYLQLNLQQVEQVSS
jgi:hypothetical protein